MDLQLFKYGAEWCHMCTQLENDFKRGNLLVPYESIDVESLDDKELNELNINNIPVVILKKKVDGAWETIHRWNGFIKASIINDYIKSIVSCLNI